MLTNVNNFLYIWSNVPPRPYLTYSLLLPFIKPSLIPFYKLLYTRWTCEESCRITPMQAKNGTHFRIQPTGKPFCPVTKQGSTQVLRPLYSTLSHLIILPAYGKLLIKYNILFFLFLIFNLSSFSNCYSYTLIKNLLKWNEIRWQSRLVSIDWLSHTSLSQICDTTIQPHSLLLYSHIPVLNLDTIFLFRTSELKFQFSQLLGLGECIPRYTFPLTLAFLQWRI